MSIDDGVVVLTHNALSEGRKVWYVQLASGRVGCKIEKSLVDGVVSRSLVKGGFNMFLGFRVLVVGGLDVKDKVGIKGHK